MNVTRFLKPMLLVALIASSPTQAVARFTFRDAEFLPLDRGIEAARAFVDAELPAGLSGSDARVRLRRAQMRCAEPRRDGAVICDFCRGRPRRGGVLGEHHWTVTLRFDPSARLASATLDQFMIGAGNPGL